MRRLRRDRGAQAFACMLRRRRRRQWLPCTPPPPPQCLGCSLQARTRLPRQARLRHQTSRRRRMVAMRCRRRSPTRPRRRSALRHRRRAGRLRHPRLQPPVAWRSSSPAPQLAAGATPAAAAAACLRRAPAAAPPVRVCARVRAYAWFRPLALISPARRVCSTCCCRRRRRRRRGRRGSCSRSRRSSSSSRGSFCQRRRTLRRCHCRHRCCQCLCLQLSETVRQPRRWRRRQQPQRRPFCRHPAPRR